MPGCVVACVRSVLGAQGPSLGTRRACALGPIACSLSVCSAGGRVLAVCPCVVCSAPPLPMLTWAVILSSSR